MRVALLTNFVPPYRIPLYEEILRHAGDLRVFVSTHMESARQWPLQQGGLDVVKQRTLTLRRQWRTDTFSEDYELHVPYDTMWQLKRWKPDVILTAEMGARSLQAVAFAKMTRTPVVLWATLADRLEIGRGTVRNAARRWLTRHADGFIVNGESGARYIRRFGVPDDRMVHVPYATDMSRLLSLPLARAADPYHLLYVGSLSERKGVELLLDGLKVWAVANPTRKVTLTLVGDGPLRAALRARPVAPNVELHWAGNVDYHALPEWYANGGIFVFPSLGDEWGLVVNEALAAGVPVLGSAYTQAVEELVRDGVNGWVFVPEDAQTVADALDRALGTPAAQLESMRVAARASVRDLTAEKAAARIVEFLEQAAAR